MPHERQMCIENRFKYILKMWLWMDELMEMRGFKSQNKHLA